MDLIQQSIGQCGNDWLQSLQRRVDIMINVLGNVIEIFNKCMVYMELNGPLLYVPPCISYMTVEQII